MRQIYNQGLQEWMITNFTAHPYRTTLERHSQLLVAKAEMYYNVTEHDHWALLQCNWE